MDQPSAITPANRFGQPIAQPLDNRVFLLILQHPQERNEPFATAGRACAVLRHAKLAVGLSWPNLQQLIGRPVDPRRWGVLYLGSARPALLAAGREIVALDRRGGPEPEQEQDAILRNLEGIVLLDGNWSQAKALWWRNPWLLKLRRLVLAPPAAARYGRVRREPRREALSTLEAAGLAMKHLERQPQIEMALRAQLDALIAAARPRHRRFRRRIPR